MPNRLLVLLCLLILPAGIARAQISLTGTNYTEDFDSMTSSGTSTPAGWKVGTTANSGGNPPTTSGNYGAAGTAVAVGSGSTNAAGNFNFGTAALPSERALGSLAGSNTQRDTYVGFTNDTGFDIKQFSISYDGEEYRSGSAATNVLTLQFSTDGTTFTNMGTGFNFTAPNMFGLGTALDGNAAGNRTPGIGGTFTPSSSIIAGTNFYLRWTDTDDSSFDDAIAIDNFTLKVTLAPVPEPSTMANIFLGVLGLLGMQYRRVMSSLMYCPGRQRS
jgi:hypothetical protein